MPYLTESAKEELTIRRDWDTIPRAPKNVGELTFVLQQALNDFLVAKGSSLRFVDLSECLAALEAAKADFTTRILNHYECGRCLENGDVWDPQLIEAVMGL